MPSETKPIIRRLLSLIIKRQTTINGQNLHFLDSDFFFSRQSLQFLDIS